MKSMNILKKAGVLLFILTAPIFFQGCPPSNGKGNVCDENDPTYKYVGGRHICKRECRPGEIGPPGDVCETKTDTGTGELYCDCGVDH